MKVNVITKTDLSVQELAEGLYHGSPKEFASFWHKLHDLVREGKEGKKKLDEWAEVMAPDMGGNKKYFFKELYELIIFHEQDLIRKEKTDGKV